MSASIDHLTILPPCRESLEIVREEPTFWVVNKPSQLLTVPGRHPANRDSVIERLRAQFPDVHAVHRLDFDTSGLLVVPLTRASLSNLSRQFQARSVKKTYIAEVHGLVAADEGIMDWPIAPDPDKRPRYRICAEGKPALTEYRVIARDEHSGCTRLALYPITGRSHQLRLHCMALGHPILGCGFYAPAQVQALSSRLLLHAARLQFHHPDSGDPLVFESAPPF